MSEEKPLWDWSMKVYIRVKQSRLLVSGFTMTQLAMPWIDMHTMFATNAERYATKDPEEPSTGDCPYN